MTTAVLTPSAQEARRSGLRRYVNLTVELAVTQFKLKYTGSLLGYVWSLVKPLAYFAIMYAVFVYLFHADKASPNFTMQLLVGIVVWTFFTEATITAVGCIAGGGHIIRKAYFPRVILVISATATALLTFFINLFIIAVIAIPLGGLHLGLQTLTLPLLLVELYLLVLGTSLFLSAVFVFYRDVGHLWEVCTQLLFYASAVVYPFSFIQSHSIAPIIAANPIAQVIEDIKRSTVTPEIAWAGDISGFPTMLVPFAITLAVLVLGALVFRRLTPRFAEAL